jgi:3-methylfumaryl-CoA hydratase
LLFRYSALTFNGHRIHYDQPYATKVEGYPGLVFHGPLTATLLMALAEELGGAKLARFSFRGVAPLFDTAPFAINAKRDGDKIIAWAETPDGALAMIADAYNFR